MKIAQIGTFDLDNLGDLLFPWITSRLFRLAHGDDLVYHCYSPTESNDIYPDQISSRSIAQIDMGEGGADYDLILIGGGDLIRDDDYSLYPVYGDKAPGLTFTQILSPVISDKVNMVLLAVGLPYDVNEDFGFFIKNSFTRLKNTSVRDERSAKYLAPYLSSPIDIVPDFVHSVPVFLPLYECRRIVNCIIPDVHSGYLCFQGHSDVCGPIYETARALKQIEAVLGKPFVLLEIGACLGDTEYLSALAEITGYKIIGRKYYPNITLEQKVSILACSDGFIGSSLHGNIISNTYGVPNVSYVGSYSHKIANYFNGESDGLLYQSFSSMAEDLSRVIDVFTNFEKKSSLDTSKHESILDFIRKSLSGLNNIKSSFDYSEIIDKVYKTGHERSSLREGVVRQQLHAQDLALSAEKENAVSHITYRDKLIEDLQNLIQAEKENAAAQITYRENALVDLNGRLEAEKENAIAQITYRNEMIDELHKMLAVEKENAHQQIAERDLTIQQLNFELQKTNADK